ncbi:MAG: hypothetical protein ACR2GR_11270 [Rhodothermales bacterium]
MNWNRIAFYTTSLLLAHYALAEIFGRWFAESAYDLTGSYLFMVWAQGGGSGYLLWPFAIFTVLGAHQRHRTWCHAGLVFALYAAAQVLAFYAATRMLLLLGPVLLDPYTSVLVHLPLILQPHPFFVSVLAAFASAGTLFGKYLASRAELGRRSALLGGA